MKLLIFVSWSGDRSKQIGALLSTWLRDFFFENVEVWLSDHDIEAGSRWNTELAKILERASFGIICLTSENINSPWLLFEARAISKSLEGTRVVPYLLDLKPTDIVYPLAQFQGVEANKRGTLKLIESINSTLPEQIDKQRIRRQFEKWWPELDTQLHGIQEVGVSSLKPERTERELLEEILTLLRTQRAQPAPTSLSLIKNELQDEISKVPDAQQGQEVRDIDRKSLVEHVLNHVAPMFPSLSKGSIWDVITSISEGNERSAIDRIRKETGAKAKEARYLVETISQAIQKYTRGGT